MLTIIQGSFLRLFKHPALRCFTRYRATLQSCRGLVPLVRCISVGAGTCSSTIEKFTFTNEAKPEPGEAAHSASDNTLSLDRIHIFQTCFCSDAPTICRGFRSDLRSSQVPWARSIAQDPRQTNGKRSKQLLRGYMSWRSGA